MDESDSENEGQLLIDESVDTSKRTRRGRKRGTTLKKTPQKKKTPLKLVVKTTATKTQRGRKPKNAAPQNSEKNEEDKVANVRTSTRVKKRVRKHSPSPVRAKKEPPKKKLKVKIKPVPKQRKKKATPSEATEGSSEKDLENVDIESVSDDELLDIQYSSVIVDEDPTERPKKSSKPKKKAGIKLKLSLGKVLAPKIAETLSNGEGEESEKPSPDDENSTPSSPEEEKHIIKPLIISKRMVSSGMSPKPDNQTSILPTGSESPYYSSSSEDHKPLTLRLSVGKPKVPKRSISEFQKSTETPSKAFPSIQRSWSVTPAKPFEPQRKDSSAESAIPKKPTEANVPIPEKSPASQPNLSTTPYFSAGLQSLLDVVSVEINEQNKVNSGTSDTNTLIENLIKHSSPPKNTFLASKISPTKLPKSPSFGNLPHSHEGHLPSMKFPKPALHFVSKKRPRSKSVSNVSPQRSAKTTSQLDDTLEVEDEEKQEEEAEETPDHILTEKERRRRDKKKVLNDDFVDPDTVLQGSEPEEKKAPKKKPLPSYIPKTKGGLSLLMPEMKSQPPTSEPKLLQMGSTCSLSSKGFIPKRPRKGLATAKQRLANKLKIRKTFAY